jgi:hypothetical protein
MFPVGLGLKVLFGSAFCFDFRLLLPVLGLSPKGNVVGTIFCISYLLLCKAHSESGYEYGKAKPTVYCISTTLTQAKPIGLT